MPAQERLEALDSAGINRDDRLVVEDEFFILQRVSEGGLQEKAAHDLLVHGAVEEFTARLTLVFGAIHRDVGILKHRLGRCFRRRQCNADGRALENFESFEQEGPR